MHPRVCPVKRFECMTFGSGTFPEPDIPDHRTITHLISSITSSALRQKGLTGCCFKYIDRPFCLRTDDMFKVGFLMSCGFHALSEAQLSG